jgi:hypothetical protein
MGSSISCHLTSVQDDRGAQHMHIVLDAWGSVSLPSPVPCILAPCIHPTSSCSQCWCGVLVILGLHPSPPHPLCTHTSHVAPLSTPQAIAHGSGWGCFAGWVSLSPLPCPPFLHVSLSSHHHLTPLVLYGGGSTSLVSLSSCIIPSLLSLFPAGVVLVLAVSWCSFRCVGRGHCISSTCNDRTMLVF